MQPTNYRGLFEINHCYSHPEAREWVANFSWTSYCGQVIEEEMAGERVIGGGWKDAGSDHLVALGAAILQPS